MSRILKSASYPTGSLGFCKRDFNVEEENEDSINRDGLMKYIHPKVTLKCYISHKEAVITIVRSDSVHRSQTRE